MDAISSARTSLDRGRMLTARMQQLRETLPALERRVDECTRAFPTWESHLRKQPILQAEDALAAAERELGEAEAEAVAALVDALTVPEAAVDARTALAQLFWAAYVAADDRLDRASAARYRGLAAHFQDGGLDRELDGAGTVALASEPTGATVDLVPLVEDGFMIVDGPARAVGTTPLQLDDVATGSYVAVLRADGRGDVRYPIAIGRNTAWTGEVRLHRLGEIPSGFVHIPGGPFVQGGDPKTKGWGHPREEVFVDDFFIARQPVTQGEYLEFLNDLVVTAGVDAAQARAPRRYPNRGSYLRVDADGRLAFPDETAGDTGWDARLPAFGISWHDADAYVGWRSAQDDRVYRLPTEVEWEKSARGVDGRWHPWGNRFDPSICNMRDSRAEGPGPVPVEEYPEDVSVYGVRGMGGNVRDWTATRIVDTAGVAAIAELGYQHYRDASDTRVVRGGAWSPLIPRVTDRYWLPPETVLSFIGFRLAMSAPSAR